MNEDLSGQVVAITGASSGIGEATALACARAGAAIALAARRADRIEALARRISDDGGRAIAIAADTQPPNVSVNEILIRPTAQAG